MFICVYNVPLKLLLSIHKLQSLNVDKMSSTSESNGSLKIPICQESMANESQTQDPHLVCDEDAQEMDSSDIGGPVANPEMPQEMVGQDLEDADTIKDTVFSKHWAISVLLEFVRVGG